MSKTEYQDWSKSCKSNARCTSMKKT